MTVELRKRSFHISDAFLIWTVSAACRISIQGSSRKNHNQYFAQNHRMFADRFSGKHDLIFGRFSGKASSLTVRPTTLDRYGSGHDFASDPEHPSF